MAFVEVPITTNEQRLKEEALARFKELVEAKGIVGFEVPAASLEAILTEVIASFGANAAVVASVVLEAAFVQFGVQFLKLAFNEGANATASSTWTVVPSVGERHIEAATEIEAGGKGFRVQTTTAVPPSASSVTLEVEAIERGIESNSISGVAQQLNPLDWVTEVQLVGETAGGEAEETAEAYRVRLAAAIELQAPRPITAANYAAFLLAAPESVAGVLVGRATSIDGYATGTTEPEGKVTNTSKVMTEITAYTGITVGTEIIGKGVPVGTVVAKLTSGEEGKKELEMSAAATATEAKQKYKMVGTFQQARHVTSFVTNKAGEALTGPEMTKLEEWLQGYRELNFVCPVEAPSYNKVYVKLQYHLLPGYLEATVTANIEAAVKAFLSPAQWGNPSPATTGNVWLNYVVKAGVGEHLYGIIRYNLVLAAAEAVPGCAYVYAGATGLEIGLTSGSKGVADLTMAGPAPLPKLEALAVAQV